MMNARILENPRKNTTIVANSNGKAKATHNQRLPASQHIITLINSEFGQFNNEYRCKTPMTHENKIQNSIGLTYNNG